MGAYCSIEKEEGRHVEKDSQGLIRNPSKLVKKHPHDPLSAGAMADSHRSNGPAAPPTAAADVQYDNVDRLDRFLQRRDPAQFASPPAIRSATHDRDGYWKLREAVVEREHALAFDWACQHQSQSDERAADHVIQRLKLEDRREVYGEHLPGGDGATAHRHHHAVARKGYGGQEHPHFYGDHFLSNVDLIARTKLMKVARAMPKAAHLHIHFNANLEPGFLLDIAKDMKQMFVTSDLPLTSEENFDRCEIQFSIVSERHVHAEPGQGDLFAPDYEIGRRRRMRFGRFLDEFDEHFRTVMPATCTERAGKQAAQAGKKMVFQWLENKLVFHEDEAHGVHQTPRGAWEKFNGRTRMMKGLFNYKTAYQRYTRKCLEEFMEENILYAEIRPNFMKTNQVWTDDGEQQMDNYAIMQLIIQEYKNFQEDLQKRREERQALEDRRRAGRKYTKEQEKLLKSPCYFGGLKIIYCTPRSFEPADVQGALEECGRFYRNPEFQPYLAGFDLVGEEGAKKYPLKNFINEFLQFRKQFSSEQIPFLFHCGETLDIGTDADGNLVDALLLDSKRIGHGFALARHPYIMEQMKKRNICLELCPISNEILGLTPRMNGHSMYNLLANNVHCTVSSDNPTLFRSSLSHDFYQVMAGKTDMTLFGWKQLIQWSLEHACIDAEARREMTRQWEKHWDVFTRWINETDWSQPVNSIPFPEAPMPDPPRWPSRP